MAESPFSFHCMICFEEFDTETRYPVVLPCGHTYVCSQCSVRLDRCMECRTPLFTESHAPELPRELGTSAVHRRPQARAIGLSGIGGVRGYAAGRAGGLVGRSISSYRQPRAVPQPPSKQRLPLPKNAVLLSLMEATEIAAEGVRRCSSPSFQDDESEKIKLGTSIATGVSGTYVVSQKEGLMIMPDMPEANSDTCSKSIGDGGTNQPVSIKKVSPPKRPILRSRTADATDFQSTNKEIMKDSIPHETRRSEERVSCGKLTT